MGVMAESLFRCARTTLKVDYQRWEVLEGVKFVIGVDPHPDTHTVAALDGNGKVVDTPRVENTREDFEALRA